MKVRHPAPSTLQFPDDNDDPTPLAVIDTNVVLDCLLFDDPRSSKLTAALLQGRLRWVTTRPMLDELADVLTRPFAAAWCERTGGDPGAVLRRASALASIVSMPGSPALPLPCADTDDQIFIDLALALPARWLFSRDRALLTLGMSASRQGVSVLRPVDWTGID